MIGNMISFKVLGLRIMAIQATMMRVSHPPTWGRSNSRASALGLDANIGAARSTGGGVSLVIIATHLTGSTGERFRQHIHVNQFAMLKRERCSTSAAQAWNECLGGARRWSRHRKSCHFIQCCHDIALQNTSRAFWTLLRYKDLTSLGLRKLGAAQGDSSR